MPHQYRTGKLVQRAVPVLTRRGIYDSRSCSERPRCVCRPSPVASAWVRGPGLSQLGHESRGGDGVARWREHRGIPPLPPTEPCSVQGRPHRCGLQRGTDEVRVDPGNLIVHALVERHHADELSPEVRTWESRGQVRSKGPGIRHLLDPCLEVHQPAALGRVAGKRHVQRKRRRQELVLQPNGQAAARLSEELQARSVPSEAEIEVRSLYEKVGTAGSRGRPGCTGSGPPPTVTRSRERVPQGGLLRVDDRLEHRQDVCLREWEPREPVWIRRRKVRAVEHLQRRDDGLELLCVRVGPARQVLLVQSKERALNTDPIDVATALPQVRLRRFGAGRHGPDLSS